MLLIFSDEMSISSVLYIVSSVKTLFPWATFCFIHFLKFESGKFVSLIFTSALASQATIARVSSTTALKHSRSFPLSLIIGFLSPFSMKTCRGIFLDSACWFLDPRRYGRIGHAPFVSLSGGRHGGKRDLAFSAGRPAAVFV